MELTYYGGGCVQIALKKLKILVDPLTGAYGPDPKTKADVVLYTQQPDHPASASAGVTIDSPGEYEMKNVSIEGVAARLHTEEDESKQDGVSFIISSGGSRVLVTGNIHPELSESQIEQLDGVDVMVVPVGGNGLTLDKDGAASVVRQFTPDAVVPVHYDDGVTDYPMPQTGVDEFLGEMGASDREPQNSMKISGRDSNEEVQVVQLALQK